MEKTCPFCKKEFGMYLHSYGGAHWFACDTCEASLPPCKTVDDAEEVLLSTNVEGKFQLWHEPKEYGDE